ncbi:MAG: bactofilin family protein [Pseudomonadota bacterium]
MFGKKASKPQARIDCLIGAGTRIDGDVTFSGGLRVDGHVAGSIVGTGEAPTTLTLSEHAKVEGEIRVSHAVINGTVVGPVHVTEYLELQEKSRITGDVHYAAVEIHLGAVVDGQLVHGKEGSQGKVVALKPATGD